VPLVSSGQTGARKRFRPVDHVDHFLLEMAGLGSSDVVHHRFPFYFFTLSGTTVVSVVFTSESEHVVSESKPHRLQSVCRLKVDIVYFLEKPAGENMVPFDGNKTQNPHFDSRFQFDSLRRTLA